MQKLYKITTKDGQLILPQSNKPFKAGYVQRDSNNKVIGFSQLAQKVRQELGSKVNVYVYEELNYKLV